MTALSRQRPHHKVAVALTTGLIFGCVAWVSGALRTASPGAESRDLAAAPSDKGRLEITVVEEADGPPVPVMASPRYLDDGRYYAPDKVVDLTGQWDNQGRIGSKRQPNLGVPLKVPSWCTEGVITLEGKPGTYEVLLRRGIEFIPHSEKVEVSAGKTTKSKVVLRRWVDMRQRGWWSGDDHVHAQILGDADAQRILAWAKAEDTHVINVVKMGDINRTWFEQRGWGPKYRLLAGEYALIPGQECPRTHQELGHTLALNLSSNMVRDTDQYYLYDRQFDGTHAQGGLVGYAHVNSGSFFVHRDMTMNVARGKVDFVELLQFGRSDPSLYYDFLNLGMRLTALAGSDVPWGGSIGEARAYAYSGDKKFSADAWYKAVRRGQTFVTNGPMLELQVDDAIPGDTISATQGQQLKIRARAWGHPKVGAPQTLEIVRFGEVIRSTTAAKPSKADPQKPGELKLAFTLDAGDGFWIAARTYATGGSQAHTTPIWVERKGLRPWKYDAVESLLAKRLDSLHSIEEVYHKRKANAKDPFVLQWPRLEERLAATRKIYEDLRRVAEREKVKRRS